MLSLFFIFTVNCRQNINGLIIKIKMSLMVARVNSYGMSQRKESFSSSDSNSNSPLSQFSRTEMMFPYPFDLRLEIFKTELGGDELSQKINQKAISWLITFCWSKDLCQECLWGTILLYYALKAQKKVKKENLQLTLLACLHLSVKMSSTKAIAMKELTAATGKAISAESLIQMQALILETLSYNIVIPHYITEVFHINLTEDQLYISLFLCELLMLKNCQIFFTKEKIEKVTQLADQIQRRKLLDEQELRNQIRGAFMLKEAKIIIRKYEPKFDMEILKVRILE